MVKAATNLQFSPTAVKIVENKAAVVVCNHDVDVKTGEKIRECEERGRS